MQTVLSARYRQFSRRIRHIVAESEFDDIKYFQKSAGTTLAKGLRDLHAMYKASGKDGHYTFLRQYLTLHRSQLFSPTKRF
jgi:hypothetical protein